MPDSYGRILSVDNESTFQKSVVDYLEDTGFLVFEASNTKDALDIFRAEKPDLVLSSLELPLRGGLELLDSIKKESPETPVVVTSGADSTSHFIEALRLGAWDYITKPLTNMAVLEHAVCRALERGRLVTENKKYRVELEKKNIQLVQSLSQLKDDQKAGKSVQQQLLPKPTMQFENFMFSHTMIPSLYLSGDFVDYFPIREDKIGFYLADVSGHGASSAFITVLLKSIVEQILANYEMGRRDDILHPEKVLKLISDNILHAKLGKYLTMIYGVLDVKTDQLSYSVGGHNPSPILWDGKKSIYLKGEGFAVGIFKDAVFKCHTMALPKKFVLAMFSDGIFEVMKGKDLPEKEAQLLALVDDFQVTSENMLNGLIPESEETPVPDDVTLLLINRGSHAALLR